MEMHDQNKTEMHFKTSPAVILCIVLSRCLVAHDIIKGRENLTLIRFK